MSFVRLCLAQLQLLVISLNSVCEADKQIKKTELLHTIDSCWSSPNLVVPPLPGFYLYCFILFLFIIKSLTKHAILRTHF